MDSTVMHINKGNAYGTQGNALTRLIFNIYHYYTHILVVSLDAPPRDVELTDSKFVRIMYLTTRNKNYIATFAC